MPRPAPPISPRIVCASRTGRVPCSAPSLAGKSPPLWLTSVPDYNKQALELRAAWSGISPKTPWSLSMELGHAWLASHPVAAERPYCTVHGDFSMHNILVRDGHLAAVVDWELAAIGDPADDLAQCRMLLTPGIIEWPEFVAAYVAAGGDPLACDPQAVAYFCI